MAFIVYWKDGRQQLVEGESYADACEKAGIRWRDFDRIIIGVLVGFI